MPEVHKLAGGALIAVGIGGAVATIASGLDSIPLIIAVWLAAFIAGVILIAYVGNKKGQSVDTETTNLPAVDTRDQPAKKNENSSNPVANVSDPESPRQRDEMATSIELEDQSPWDATPTSEIYVPPPSHIRLLDAQRDGDFLVWDSNHQNAETESGNEPKVLKLPPGKWLHIGRSPKSDIKFSVDYTPISRRHAAVKLTEPGILLVRDLGSLNGTWVNGESVAAYCLQNGVKAMPVRADADIVVGGAAISYGWRPNSDKA